MAKIHNTTQSNYTMVSNLVLRNKNLSWKAKGLLAWLLGCEDGFEISLAGIVAMAKDGETSVDSAVKELKDNGFVIIERSQASNGQFDGQEWHVFDTPQLGNFTERVVSRQTVFPTDGKSPPNKTIDNKTNSNNLDAGETTTSKSRPIKVGSQLVYPSDFEQRWSASWKKGGKLAAFEAVKKAISSGWTIEQIFERAEKWMAFFTNKGWSYDVSTWINGKHFTEDPVNEQKPALKPVLQPAGASVPLGTRYARIEPYTLSKMVEAGATPKELAFANVKWSIYNRYLKNSGCTVNELLNKIRCEQLLLDTSNNIHNLTNDANGIAEAQ